MDPAAKNSPQSIKLSRRKHGSRLGQMGELLAHARWLLGDRSSWIVSLPLLAVGAAASEVVLLVSIVRSLLLLVDPTSTTELGLGPLSADLTSSQLVLVAVAASLISIGLRSAEAFIVGRLASRAAFNARSQLIESYFAADWQAMADMRSGRLQQLLGTNVQMASVVVPLLASVLASIINLAVYGTFIAVSSPLVGATFAILGVAMVSAFSVLRRTSRSDALASQTHVRDVQLAATTFSTLDRELQLFNVQAAARHELHRLNTAARRSLARVRTLQHLLPSLFQQTVLLAVVGLVYGALQLDLNASSFGTASILAVRSLSYLQQLNASNQNYVELAPYLWEVHTAIEDYHDRAKIRGDKPLDTVESLALNDIWFSYGSSPALRGISLRLEAGEWLGIIGPSGSGKTTLANILAGLLAPEQGSYLVNGVDATNFTAQSWADRFGLLSQEPTLIRGSLSENISFFRGGTDDEVEAAAESAAIAADVRSLPDAWDTQVGDGQAGLSGGQRQRIALARALLGKPSVLILDEPTSALDAENERLIEDSLFSLAPETIVIVASHRPTLLNRCSRFVVIESGEASIVGRDEGELVDRFVRRQQ